MKKFILIVAALFTVCSCDFSSITNRFVKGNGVPVDVPVTVANFDSISSVGSIDVYYTQAPGAPSVVLTCDENTVDYYEVTVSKGVLKVDIKTGYVVIPKTKSFVTVRSSSLKGVKLTGSGDCYVSGNLIVDEDIDFTITGSGNVTLTGRAYELKQKVTGSGRVNIKGLELPDY